MKLFGEQIQFEPISTDDSSLAALETDTFKAYFSTKTGFLTKLVAEDNEAIESKIKFVKYGTTNAREKSGAYLFLPDGPADDIGEQLTQWIRVENSGKLRQRVCVNKSLLLHCVEFYPTLDKSNGFKFPLVNVWNVVDLRQSHNYELAMQIQTQIQNNNEFHTDLNGFQYTKRKNYEKLTIQGNVYPMPSGAFIQDSNLRMNVLTGQPLGVSSQMPSSLEIFLDRRLDQDDNRGMEQAMDDNVVTSSKFLIFFEKLDNKLAAGKPIASNHPSLTSQLLSFDLINPVVKLILNKDEQVMKKSLILGNQKKNNYPCDLRLVNLRTMQTSNEQPQKNEVGLILHRVAYEDCVSNQLIQLPSPMQTRCSGESSKMSFQDFFEFFSRDNQTALVNMKIKNTYLTLQTKTTTLEQPPSKSDPILDYVQPMQIEAFKIKL